MYHKAGDLHVVLDPSATVTIPSAAMELEIARESHSDKVTH